jgi:methanogenic corrinoid protein MtbC1
MLLRSHGFTVTDLGVDVSSAQFAEAALQHRPDIIAISGLLTISYESMKEIIRKIKNLEDRSLASIPIIIGGGTMSAIACAFVGADYWATDAMVGVRLCRQIIAERKTN